MLRPISLALILTLPQFSSAQDEAGIRFFEEKIRPVLVEHCYSCHSADAKKFKGGLRLDSKATLLKGGETGPALIPGKPNESLLIKAIRYTHEELKMPPKEKLPAPVIADLERWVAMGAPDPRTAPGNVTKGINFTEAANIGRISPSASRRCRASRTRIGRARTSTTSSWPSSKRLVCRRRLPPIAALFCARLHRSHRHTADPRRGRDVSAR